MRLAATLVALAATALAAASPAKAAWTHERVASTGTDYGEVALATNQLGDAALLFDTGRGLSLALARPGHDFGRPRAVPHVGDDSSPGVAVDDRGNVLVVWNYNDHTVPAPPFSRDDDCCERVRVALLRAGSTRFSGPKTFGTKGTDAYLEAFSLVNGKVGVAWSEDGDVVARLSRRSLDFRPALRAPGSYALAVDPLSTGPVLTFLRVRYEPERSTLFDLVVRRGRPPALRKVLSRNTDLSSIDVASNARGDQALAWPESSDESTSDVFAAVRSRGGRLRLRRVGRRDDFTDPRVAIARDGAAVVGWANGNQVLTAARRRGAAFGKGIAFTRRRRGVVAEDVQVAAGAGGRAVVAWREITGLKPTSEHAALRTRGGRRLSERNFGSVTNFGSLDTTALDGHGVARVAWANGPVYAARARFPGR